MTYKDWLAAGEIIGKEYGTKALIFALFETADRATVSKLRHAFRALWNEHQYRASRPDGFLPSDNVADAPEGVLRSKSGAVLPARIADDDYPPEFIRKTDSE